jgi:Flp pilus assembly protein CpaB
MNRKQFIILLVLVVVVGAAGLLVRQRSNNSWQGGGTAIGQKLLPNLAVNDVAQIAIKSGTNELNLVKRDNLWRVRERGDYPANFSQISEVLMKLADLKIAQTEEIGRRNWAGLNCCRPAPDPTRHLG